MSKLSTGSNRYLKAQLRPLTKPTFWASASLFGISLFALANLLQQPDAVLNSGDRNAIVNLDENESLTPEERARAAEIDDLSVLLKDLDKSRTIASESSRINQAQTTNLEVPDAIANLEVARPTPQVTSSGGQFTPLPPINIAIANEASGNQASRLSSNLNSTNSGFIGFDPRSSGQVSITSSNTTSNEVAPLTAALERYSAGSSLNQNTTTRQQASSADPLPLSATSSNSRDTAIAVTGQRNGIPSNGVQPNGSPTYVAPLSTFSPTIPNGNSSQNLSQQNSDNNAYTQIFNPNLVVPSPTALPQPATPNLPSQPVTAGSPNLNRVQPITSTSTNLSQTATSPTSAVFGAPSNSPTVAPANSAPSNPVISNPVPFSVTNNIPGQHSGNGRINTFANP